MNSDLFEALSLLEKERGIPVDFMVEKISKAIEKACKNNYNGNDDVVINMDQDKSQFEVYLRKTVVEDVTNPGKEISLSDARNIDVNTGIDDKVLIKLDTKDFGRIAAQTARNIIRQGIRDGERGQTLKEFQSRLNEIVTAYIEKIDPKTGAASLRIGKSEAVLTKNEQIRNEKLVEGSYIKVYLVDVKESEKGPRAILTRVNPIFIKKLMEQEIPEFAGGVIEIKAIARELGVRTKVAVYSHDENVDAVGACIGARGSRIAAIIKELNGEKIDIIEYSEDPVKYVAAALLPAKVVKVEISNENSHKCKVVVNDKQLSLAIGNKGLNARLAARLTGWRIDIKPESKVMADESSNIEEDIEQDEDIMKISKDVIKDDDAIQEDYEDVQENYEDIQDDDDVQEDYKDIQEDDDIIDDDMIHDHEGVIDGAMEDIMEDMMEENFEI